MFKNLRKKLNVVLTGNVGTGNSSFREEWLKVVLSEIPKGKKILDAGAEKANIRFIVNI